MSVEPDIHPTPQVRVGLIGRDIQGSRSPGMHMLEAKALGLDLTYVLFDLGAAGDWRGASLAQALDQAEADGFAGVNITYPFKQSVIALLHELSPEARRLGAVNTVVFRDGRRYGHNTDCSGFAESFRRALPGAPRDQAVQLGAGGAGAAVAYALLDNGVGRLGVHDIDLGRAADLAAAMQAIFGADRAFAVSDLAQAVGESQGLVNATPVGMARAPGLPLPAELLRSDLWVAEVVYFPLRTALVEAAEALGCRTVDGGGMAVFQAADAFRLFTGYTPDAERMRARFLETASGGAAAAHD